MTRMRRLAPGVVTTLGPALSLLTSVAVCVLWARSYSRLTAAVLVRTSDRVYAVSVVRGGAAVGCHPIRTRRGSSTSRSTRSFVW